MGKSKEKIEKTNICKLVKEAVDVLSSAAKKNQIKIIYENACLLEHEVESAPKHLFQILENLISNAIKYTPKKGVVKVSVEHKSGNIIITVSDNGIGIPDEDKDNIFKKFYRASNAVLKETDGTGLGLSVVKSFVEECGGKIWFESQVGKGTTFYIELPAIKK